MVRLYRFYNVEHHNYGEPFACCDEHLRFVQDRVAGYCLTRKIADKAVDPCVECERIAEEGEETGCRTQTSR